MLRECDSEPFFHSIVIPRCATDPISTQWDPSSLSLLRMTILLKIRAMRHSSLHFFLFFLLLALVSPSLGWGLEIPTKPDGYVTDRAQLLSSAAKEQLEQNLYAFEQSTSTQIVVGIFPSLEDESLEDVSIRLAEQWKIGQAGQDNGVILLIFPNDRKLRIETGYGLEGVLTDAVASQIISGVIAPRFRDGDFDGGVLAGVRAIQEAVRGEFTVPVPTGGQEVSLGPIVSIIVVILLIVGIVDAIRFQIYFFTHRRYQERFGLIAWSLRFAWLLILLNIFFRLVLHSMLSGRGGGVYGSRSGFGGGFSGGGGGSFGGGGASGGW